MRTILTLVLLFIYSQVATCQSEFLKNTQWHENIYESGFSSEDVQKTDSMTLGSNDYDQLMQDGLDKLNSGKYRLSIKAYLKAKSVYKNAIGETPAAELSFANRNPYPDYYLGINFTNLNRTDSALFYFKSAIEEAPFFSNSYNEIGNILLQESLLDSAQYYFKQGLKLNEQSEALNHNIGLTYYRNSNFKQAHKYFLKNIGVNSNFAPSYILAANIYEQKKNFHMAEILYSKGITISERSIEYVLNRGYYYIRTDELDKAFNDLKYVYDENPKIEDVLWQLALLELKYDKYKNGVVYIQELLEINSNFFKKSDDITYEYGNAELVALLKLVSKQGLHSYETELFGMVLAEAFFATKHGTYKTASELIKEYPNSEIINRIWIYSKSFIYLNDRDRISISQANHYISQIDEVLKKFDVIEIRLLKGILYYYYGYWDLSIKALNEVIMIDKRSVLAQKHLGYIYSDRKEYHTALKYYSNVISLVPDYIEVINAIGLVYEQMGRLDKAIEKYKYASRININHQDVLLNNIGISYFKMGLVDSALTYFNRAIFANNKYARAYASRGSLFETEGQIDRALDDYNTVILLDSKQISVLKKRANLFEKKGKLKLAESNYTKYLKYFQQNHLSGRNRGDIHPTLQKYIKVADTLIDRLKYEKKKDSAEFLLKKKRYIVVEYSRYYEFVGRMSIEKLEYDEGLDFLRIALEIDPHNLSAKERMANLALQIGQHERSIRLFRELKKVSSGQRQSEMIQELNLLKSNDELAKHVEYIIDHVFYEEQE